jgi:hypothetical protein
MSMQAHSGSGERVMYQDQTVTVTTARAIVAGVTYAMANITSVRQFAEPADTSAAIVLGVLAVIFGGVMALLESYFMCVLSLLAAVAFFYWASQQKPKHWVKIGTAGAETNAIWSHDPMFTSRIVVAINEAIIARG